MNESDFTHWLELPEGTKHVVFGDLPHLIAKALWPDHEVPGSTNWAYGGARVNLEDELPKAVDAGQLAVKDPLTFGPHSFPLGAALKAAVVLLPDLRAFLARRSMGVRVAMAPSAQLFPVEGVAREAAVRRHPIPEGADADGRVLAEAWQGWTAAALLIQLNGYVHDRKVSVFFRGAPLPGPHEAFDVPKDEWQVDEAGQRVLLGLFIEDPMRVLPTFHVPPCPSETPPALLLLSAEARVRLQWTWQRLSESVGSVAEAVEVFAEVIARQADGWLRIDEAAQLLKEAGRGSAANWRDKFLAAAQSGGLPTHEPGTYDRVKYEPLSSFQQPRRARDFYEVVHVDDLNAWLASNEPRLPYRFPAISAQPSPSAEPAPACQPAVGDGRGLAASDGHPADAPRVVRQIVRHSTDDRRQDLLTPLIRMAEELAGQGGSSAQVWAQLEHMARGSTPPAPLSAVTSGGVVYFDGPRKKTFTLRALRDRLRRARAR